MKVSVILSSLSLNALVVTAQQSAWGQCGGIGWSGATSCVSGYSCVYSNAYYSQCIPGTQSSTTRAAATTTTSKSPATTSASSSQRTIKYWFSFGDSYTATGFSPTGAQPSTSNPLGNPTYPGYTSSNGIVWIDVATVKYNKSPVLTYNLAYGGATIDASLVAPFQSSVLSLTDQVNQFNQYYANHPSSAPWSSSNTLFSIFIGINDVGNAWSRSDFSSFADTLLNAEFALVQKLYNAGARNFLWINVPPTDRSPTMVSAGSYTTTGLKAAIATWNSKLASRISSFKSSNSGVYTLLVDSNSLFNTILNNPTAYGLKSDILSYGTDPTLAWNNNYHPGIVIQDNLGKLVANSLSSNGFW